jgi:hypothetical protein
MLSLRKTISSSITKSKKLLDTTIKHDSKQIIIGLVFCIVIALALWGVYRWYINKYTLQEVPSMKRPFLNMWGVRKDGSEFLTNIVFITHPFTRDECIVQYNDAKNKGVHFLGLSSYSEFPGPISNKHDVLHDRTIDAWTKYDYFQLIDII